ncbi:MAG: N-6 DNA methylase, partial [Proteobacteria bacterium]|nr:N-6 DNA methylase [Pseudomonadota bacterium]MCG2757232.1 BREX-1 system adenine-specific DNA-methyltransferase PglX [Desulfobacteraceae bacterium]
TPARRWSFLVGENEKSHTAQIRLVDILANDKQDPTLAEIQKAFDIETVTKEFFLKYRELFLHTKEELDKVVKKDSKVEADFEAKGVDTVNFAKKLLGQIVFLYFLQKKGWFGVGRDNNWGTGSKHFLRELFEKKHGDYNNFFNDILEPLFYEALRTGEDREHEDYYYSRFNCKIPFLNGGLFDPIGNYDWVHTDILLPNNLFSNSNETKEGDEGDGILDIFDRYNFTVKEDEPLEKEVAIDPELLGKSYEKFNAIRPDNYAEFKKALKSGKKGEENKFNKKFGVYYTPREIVHYMCQQSLINYLDTAVNTHKESIITKPAVQKKIFGPQSPVQQILTSDSYKPIIPKKDIETLIHTGEQFSENEARVLSKGKETKTYFHQLPESIRKNAKLLDDKLAEITVCDPAVGSGAFPVGMMSEIVKARNVLSVFIDDKKRKIYNFKRRCIEHSLYGVDIDPGAVEIAKLRLWLSLVVDEDDIKNIKPLPNLDYKVVCGNSLLGVEKNLFNYKLFNELEKLKPLFFNETNPTKKQEYKKQIDKLISEITSGHTEFDFEVYFSEVFHEKDGFDVVIANPPYIFSRENLTKADKVIYKKRYFLTQFKINLYILFVEKSYHLMNKNGCFAFIIPNNWLTLSTTSDLRYFVLNNTCNISVVLNYDSVFENASVDTCLLLFSKTGDSILDAYSWTENGVSKISSQSTRFYLGNSNYIISNINAEDNIIGNICKNILSQSKPLSAFAEVRNGVQAYTVGEGTPVQSKQMKVNRVYHSHIKKGKDWIKYLDGVDVGRYRCSWSGQFIKYGKNLSRPRKPELFKGERLLVRQIPSKPPYSILCCYIDENAINDNNSMIIRISDGQVNLKYIQCLINSRLISFWFIHTFGKLQRKTFPQFKVKELRTFPICEIPLSDQKPFIKNVDQILTITKCEDYLENQQKQAKVKSLEAEIDQLVYKLYGLTHEEIKIVEGGLRLTLVVN